MVRTGDRVTTTYRYTVECSGVVLKLATDMKQARMWQRVLRSEMPTVAAKISIKPLLPRVSQSLN